MSNLYMWPEIDGFYAVLSFSLYDEVEARSQAVPLKLSHGVRILSCL